MLMACPQHDEMLMRELHWKARRDVFLIVKRGKLFVLPSQAAKSIQKALRVPQLSPSPGQGQPVHSPLQQPSPILAMFPSLTINTTITTPLSTTTASSPLHINEPAAQQQQQQQQPPPRRRSNNRIPDLRYSQHILVNIIFKQSPTLP